MSVNATTEIDGARPPGTRAGRWGWWLLAIILLALALRAYAVARYPALPPVTDAAHYHQLATDLAEGRGFVYTDTGVPTAFRPIGYPAFVAGVYAIFGPDPRAAYWFHVALGGVTVLLIVLLTRMLFGPREALWAGLIAAVYPGFIWLTRVLLSENLALPLLLAALCAAVALLRAGRGRLRWAAALGVLLGLGVLVRSNNSLIVVLLLLGLLLSFWKSRAGGRAYASLGVVVLAVLFVLLPWEVRNYRVFGRVVPLTTNDGITLYGAYWPPLAGAKRIYGNVPGLEDPAIVAASQAGDEAEVSAYLRRLTLRRLRENPRYYFRLLPEKLFYMVVPVDWETFPRPDGSQRSLNVGYALACLLALFGLWALWRRRVPHLWLLWPLPASVLVQTLVFYGGPRYRLPAELTIIPLAAVGVVWAAGALLRGKVIDESGD
jgi:4-amino-4-deoxy-L-arabinose transferase-like glycosyltransferase